MNPKTKEDMGLLEKILHSGNTPELTQNEILAFQGMHDDLRTGERVALSKRQKQWATETWERVKPIDNTKVPRGREVPTPAVLQNPREALLRKPPRKPL